MQGAADSITLKTVSMERPWTWLAAGWTDLTRAAPYSLAYGFVFVGVGALITAGLWLAGLSAWIPVAAGGFALLGPILAVGLYEISRRLDEGEPLSWDALYKVRPRAPAQLALIGALLMALFLVWWRVAQLLYALFSYGDYVPLNEFAAFALTDARGLALLVVGSLIGGAIAFAVFSVSVISVPILLRRNVDVVTAVIMSVDAVRKQPAVMLLWAWIVAVVVAVGFATALVGLIVAFPLLGHATWHAYRDLVVPKAP